MNRILFHGTVAVLALTSLACSTTTLQQRPLMPIVNPSDSGVSIVQTMSPTSPEGIEVNLRQGAMQFSLSEQGELVRLDVVATNDGTRTLGLPPTFFAVVDATGAALPQVPPHEAANKILANVGASLIYTEKRVFSEGSYSNSAALSSDAEAWSKLNTSIRAGNSKSAKELGIDHARELYESGLIADATVESGSHLRGAVYFQRPGDHAYPLQLQVPAINREFAFKPGQITSSQHVAMATGIPDDTSPFVPSDHSFGGGMAVMLYGSWAQYAMSDVNDGLEAVSEFTGEDIDPVKDGFGVGIDMLRHYTRNVTVGIGVEKLFGKTEYSVPLGELTFDFGGWGFRGIAQYAALQNARFRIALEAGVGMVLATGSLSSSLSSADVSIGGSGFLAQGGIPIEFAVTPRVSMFTRAGYRYAEVKQVTIEGDDPPASDGDSSGIDYSGIFSQIGISIR